MAAEFSAADASESGVYREAARRYIFSISREASSTDPMANSIRLYCFEASSKITSFVFRKGVHIWHRCVSSLFFHRSCLFQRICAQRDGKKAAARTFKNNFILFLSILRSREPFGEIDLRGPAILEYTRLYTVKMV